jgi:TATA-binding protein-associated factor
LSDIVSFLQNNIMELWSLFDFLMPGFLGTERQFQASYGKPLLAARDPKCSAKDAEAGVLAMEALHKQVMLFLEFIFSDFLFSVAIVENW